MDYKPTSHPTECQDAEYQEGPWNKHNFSLKIRRKEISMQIKLPMFNKLLRR